MRTRKTLCLRFGRLAFVLLTLTVCAFAQNEARRRARDYGVKVGVLQPGRFTRGAWQTR